MTSQCSEQSHGGGIVSCKLDTTCHAQTLEICIFLLSKNVTTYSLVVRSVVYLGNTHGNSRGGCWRATRKRAARRECCQNRRILKASLFNETFPPSITIMARQASYYRAQLENFFKMLFKWSFWGILAVTHCIGVDKLDEWKFKM